MPIYTEPKHGQQVIGKFVPMLGKRREFIAKGEASETPVNQWVCAFSLRQSKTGVVYGLELEDFGDPDCVTEADEPFVTVVAIYDRPRTNDKSKIVREMLNRYRRDGGKYIEMYHDSGAFDL